MLNLAPSTKHTYIMIKKTLIALVIISLVLITGLYATGNGYLVNAFQRSYLQGHTTANINDAEAFNVVTIKASNHQPLPKSAHYNQRPLSKSFIAEQEKWRSVAYLVLKDGEIESEHYFNGYTDRSKTNSFSMAKTVLTMMVGIAIDEGIIKSFDQPITDYLPEFANDPFGKKATLANLSLMNSGYDWIEHYYSIISPTVELYHGTDMESFLPTRGFSDAPGERWYYSSASTQLLGLALKRALKKAGRNSSLANYLSEKIWQPLGMNDSATWHTDDAGTAMVYCCINTNAQNWAKLGQLMLNGGVWQNQQIVPAAFIKKMIRPDGAENYGYSTWLNYQHDPAFYHFSGHLGQSVSIVPEENLVVVRLGEKRDDSKEFQTESLPEYIAEAQRLVSLR